MLPDLHSPSGGPAQEPNLFFGPVQILPREFYSQSLPQSLSLPASSEASPSGPTLPALLESSSTGPRLLLFMPESSWFCLALLNNECHEYVAMLLALPDQCLLQFAAPLHACFGLVPVCARRPAARLPLAAPSPAPAC